MAIAGFTRECNYMVSDQETSRNYTYNSEQQGKAREKNWGSKKRKEKKKRKKERKKRKKKKRERKQEKWKKKIKKGGKKEHQATLTDCPRNGKNS
jgi:hypothetical protein